MSLFIKKNYFIVFVIFSGFPLFFLPDGYWDSAVIDYGFVTENFSGIEIWYREASSYFQLFLLYLIFFLQKITDIPHEFLLDIFTIIALILFSYEVKKYSEIVFEFNNKFSNLCAIFIISFPIWHTLVAFNLGLYLICFYLAMLGYRLFVSKDKNIKIIGIIIILFSFSIKSNLAFVIGLCLAHNLKLFFNGQLVKKYSLFFIIFICTISYFVNIYFFPPFGILEGYNEVTFKNLNFFDLIKNVYNFITFFIFYLWIPLFYLLILKFKKKNIIFINIFEKKVIDDFLVITIIFITSIAPYLLVNSSTDLFFISDYQGRHAYLMSLSFGLFFTVLIKKINEIYNNRKIHLFIITLFVLQNLLILSGGYYTKIETAIFKYDFVEKLKKIDEPPGGNIQILGSQISSTFRKAEGNYLFYKAYGKASWWTNFLDQKVKENFKVPEVIVNRDDYKTKYVFNNYNLRCNTVIQLTNEISQFDRIFKLYVLNFREYFKINVLKTTC